MKMEYTMQKYEVYVSLSDDGGDEEFKSVVSARRMKEHADVEGLADVGWCFGQEIGDALCSMSDYFTKEQFDHIFEAIQDNKEEHNRV